MVARSFLYLIYGLIVAGLITAIALGFHSSSSKTPAPAKPNTSHQVVKAPSQPQLSKQHPSKSSTSSSQGTAANSTGQLSNSGPGDTLGLFVLATITGTIIYRRRLVRRLN